jgi:hypothetical protein
MTRFKSLVTIAPVNFKISSVSLFFSLFLAFPVSGCGGDDSGNGMAAGGSHDGTTEHATCRASIKPSTINYFIDGDTLQFTGAEPLTLTRAKASTLSSAKPVYGTWQVPVQHDPGAAALGLTINATFDIEADHVVVTAACAQHGRQSTASVTSGATVTDTTITTSDFKVDEKQF